MTFWLLVRRSLRFHARSHLGVVLGAAIGSAALIGALLVGDSVRGSLRERALARLGSVEYALSTRDRFFTQSLRDRLRGNKAETAAPDGKGTLHVLIPSDRMVVLQVAGVAARQDGQARANQVNILGIDLPTWRPLPQGKLLQAVLANQGWTQEARTRWTAGETVLLNQTLATQLRVSEGDDVVLRIAKPTQLALDAVINPRDESSVALRLKVGRVLGPELLGDFSLAANQSPPANAFLPLDFLSHKLDLDGRANLLLSGPFSLEREMTWWDTQLFKLNSWFFGHRPPGRASLLESILTPNLLPPAPPSVGVAVSRKQLEHNWSLEDAQISVDAIEQPPTMTGDQYVQPSIEVHSSRIFLEPLVVAAALKPRNLLVNQHTGFENDSTNDVAVSKFVSNGIPILTYLANLIRDGQHSTPYSMITAAGGNFAPVDMRDNEILINEWLAEDLQAKTGDPIQVSYYVVDSASHLVEQTNTFVVRSVVPMKGKYADRTLMPEFPGIAKAERTQDWDTGFPLVYKIRDKDEAYWKKYRGTPKAFVTLKAGQAMWSNRFGTLTSIRYEVPTNSFPPVYRDLVYRNLLANLDPAELGFRFQPIREQALAAANQSQDFGQLFIAFSIFVVVAALLLMALLFQFGLEQRRAEVGTLLALGLRPRQVRRLLLAEGAVLAVFGSVLGALAGAGYAKAMLWALSTIWRSAIAGAVLHFYTSATTWVIGCLAGTLVAALTLWLTLRKQARQPARELLSGEATESRFKKGRLAPWIAAVSAVVGLALIGYAVVQRQTSNAEMFFEAGSLLLVAGLAAAAAILSLLQRWTQSVKLNLSGLGVRSCSRRRTRSLGTIALLACGCFVIVSVGAFRLDANQDANKRSSGTGGFALIGGTTLPVIQDLDTQAGQEFFGLSLRNASVISFRVRTGDEASCLNLNRAQRPRLLGVKPDLLTGRFTFVHAAKGLDVRQGWNLLRGGDGPSPRSVDSKTKPGDEPSPPQQPNSDAPDEVPAIGDANSIEWALGKSVGDTIDYTDETGRTFKLRLVASVANSILQGSLIIDEAQFVKKFPSESGYRFFLIDTPAAAHRSISATLSSALQDVGLELTPAVDRLNAFNAVQNTYLGTFQILGGLGLLLGSGGLGVVVLRNVLERRGELGVLVAVGFRKRALSWLVLAEHGALLGFGLLLGVAAAAVAVLPALLSPARQLPYASLAVTLAAVLVNGAFWTWLATRIALRGDLLAALRNE